MCRPDVWQCQRKLLVPCGSVENLASSVELTTAVDKVDGRLGYLCLSVIPAFTTCEHRRWPRGFSSPSCMWQPAPRCRSCTRACVCAAHRERFELPRAAVSCQSAAAAEKACPAQECGRTLKPDVIRVLVESPHLARLNANRVPVTTEL
jgi:hypothetical protein